MDPNAYSLVLDTTKDSPSDVFVMAANSERAFALCDTHNGGVWTLQVQSPEDVWLDTDVEIDSTTGPLAFFIPPGSICRFSGGTTGARIWVTDRG